KLIVKTNGVITYSTSVRYRKFCQDPFGKFMFWQSPLQTKLRGNSSHQASVRIWQGISGGLTVKRKRLADNVEISIRANTRELGWSCPTRVFTEGFIIVPIKS